MTTSLTNSMLLPMSPNGNGNGSPNSAGRPGTSGGFSTASTARRRKKKDQAVFTLEDVFYQFSTANTSNLSVPVGRIVLTPRSAEACLKLGVNPEILKVRDIDSFWEPGGMEPVVQRMRHEAYVQRRHDTMKQCRIEKKRITNAMFEASGAVDSTGEEAMTPDMILQKQKAQSSTLIQMEMAKIAKMQVRQEKELGQMIQYEIARTKVQEEMTQRIEVQKRREEQSKRQAGKRNKLAAEERRLKDLQKAALEEVEEENRRILARDMHEKERMLADQRARKEHEQRRRVQEDEIERIKKAEEHKTQVQKFFAEEQSRLRERLENMNFAERKKHDALIKRQKEHAERQKERREKIEKRIEINMSMAEKIEEKRKNDFLDKQEHFERIRTAHLQQQDQDRMLHSQEVALQEQRRHMIMIQQRREEERAAERLLGKFEDDEEHVQVVQEMRDREHNLHRERKSLRVQMKLENIERVMRQGEYKKSLTLKKIESSDSRIKSMLSQRQSLTEERRRAAASIRIQRENVSKLMDEVRTNASKANKIINAAMTGKMPLQEITSGPGRGVTAPRKKKAGSKAKRSRSVSDLLNLNQEQDRSKSAGEDAEYSFDDFNNDRSEDEGPGSAFLTSDQAAQSAPLPYISPYV